MAPKRGLGGEATLTKRMKARPTSPSRSATPVGINFSVQYPPKPRNKGQRPANAQLHVSPFLATYASKKGELNQYYLVTPSAEWGSMKVCKNFISKFKMPGNPTRGNANNSNAVQGEMYTVNQFVYVRGQDTPKGIEPKDKDFWIAKVLEVRAVNPQQVYALVCQSWFVLIGCD
jgi:hypothetical protein